MPWKEKSPMNERTRFLSDYLSGHDTVSELCRRYDISRKTGYKWIGRYVAEGPAGLGPRTSRPLTISRSTPEPIVRELLRARERHPTWGAKKLLTLVQRKHPTWKLPAKSTAHDILRRHGLVPRPRRRRRRAHPGRPVTEFTRPNLIWTADFKGQFKTKDGVYCYPLTIQDGYSRFLLAVKGLKRPTIDASKPVFRALFKRYGLPERIRTDNGAPFAAAALGRLSRLSVWFIELGIIPEFIEPGKPQQNGRHERMHRTLKRDTTLPPAKNLRGQQRRFDAFQLEFNTVRPHEALDQRTPADLYRASKRLYTPRPGPITYPAHFDLRKVSTNGGIRWNARRIPVSHLLAGHNVGLEEIDHDVFDVYFGPLWLGRFFVADGLITDQNGSLKRKIR